MKKIFLILNLVIVVFSYRAEISIACHEESMGGDGGIWPTLKGHNPSTRSNGLLVFTESTTAATLTTTSCDEYTSFLEKNYDLIAETIARGNGIFLDSLGSIYGCLNTSNRRLSKLLRENYVYIFNNTHKNGITLDFRLKYVLKSDKKISSNCLQLI